MYLHISSSVALLLWLAGGFDLPGIEEFFCKENSVLDELIKYQH